MASRNLLLGMTPPVWCRHVLRSLAIARKLKDNNTLVFWVVPAAGLEPARPFGQEILSLRCLPFHHAGLAPS